MIPQHPAFIQLRTVDYVYHRLKLFVSSFQVTKTTMVLIVVVTGHESGYKDNRSVILGFSPIDFDDKPNKPSVRGSPLSFEEFTPRYPSESFL